jgi:cell division cycle 2-like protein
LRTPFISHGYPKHRAPEILLGVKTYSTAVDMWSVGCIFAELMLKEPLFQAKAEIELLSMIFKLLGPPTNDSWPEYSSLPLAKSITLPSPQPHQFRQKFPFLTVAGIDLLSSLLTYDPEGRISAEEALQHPYFSYVLVGLHMMVVAEAILQRDPSTQASRHV